ncbi:MAG: hypothetical protein R3224_03145 [Balneolaceae bacterium]|nr:hypothetical protein [Balneolaceae bacterium]
MFEMPGITSSEVQDAFLYYKYDGEVSYQQVRAELDLATFETEFSIENENAGMLEYYFEVELISGERVTYPENTPGSNPVQVDIVEREQEVISSSDEQHGIEYTILSPEPGTGFTPSDALIAITLFYDESAIDTASSSFQLLLDGEDITDQAQATDFFLSYAPQEISLGEHRATLQLQTSDETVEIVSWGFTVYGPSQVAGTIGDFGQETNTLIPAGQAELTAQNQSVGGVDNDVLRGNVRLSGRQGEIRYTAYGLLTTQESARLQPQNRYGAELYVGEWLEFQAGHIYPSLSRLSISGRRIQGINSSFHLLKGDLNLQFLYGKMSRSIPNRYEPVTVDTVESGGVPIDTTYSLNFQQNGTGTFQRNVIGGRLGFGRGRNFQWGFNLLKVRDDTTSINNITTYDDLVRDHPDLDNALTQTDLNRLQENPDRLSITGNPEPKDNVVAGTDLMFNLFKDKIRFRTEGAVSLLNENISGGVLTDDNDLGLDINDDVSTQLERLSWLIIINENMSTLPFRFKLDGDSADVETFFPTGVLASQSELNFNIPANSFRLQYRWIGPDFVSLANSTIRRDVAGFTLTDRFNLLQNRLYVTLGYEILNDNVIDNKVATTNTNTLRTNLSWFPIDQYLPRLSLGVMYRNRDNGESLFNPFVGTSEDIAIRNFEISEGDTLLAANPRLSNTVQLNSSISQQFNFLDLHHDASLNFTFLNTLDDVFRYGDTKNTSVNLTLRSQLNSIPLDTRVGFNINTTETLGGLTDISIFGVTVGGSMFFMDDRLNVSGNLAYTNNTIESTPLDIDDNGTPADSGDDLFVPGTDESGNPIVEETKNNLFIFRASAQYELNDSHAFLLNVNFTNVSNRLAGPNPPNDHMLQARYIYRF